MIGWFKVCRLKLTKPLSSTRHGLGPMSPTVVNPSSQSNLFQAVSMHSTCELNFAQLIHLSKRIFTEKSRIVCFTKKQEHPLQEDMSCKSCIAVCLVCVGHRSSESSRALQLATTVTIFFSDVCIGAEIPLGRQTSPRPLTN